jgi:hypothetical protein
MINLIRQHLTDNRGDENTSKMIWVAIVFVVGAILLLLITTAFKEPIKNWYDDTIAEWFDDKNGQYCTDALAVYEKNDNGTYKDFEYILHLDDGRYVVVQGVEYLTNTSDPMFIDVVEYSADGVASPMSVVVSFGTSISDDGSYVVVGDEKYYAQLP